ncbi:RDD family protein [Pontibacter sp. G13]|uniref:RDD family protein n=1 Tax=Pontibacter sp. G13 TaxID=3074898 RepID=UPI00288A1337|nr:RDD family protein [Pontibacter sp. G13]WNJ18163.1 RDD family protein [Pontibacter sp. G13]
MNPTEQDGLDFESQLSMEDFQAEMLEPASAGVRFLNYIIDNFVVQVVSSFAILPMIIATSSLDEEIGLGTTLLATYGSIFVYYAVLEGLTGQTVGKMLTGTVVIDAETYEKPTFSQIAGRTLSRWVPFEAFSFLGSEPTGWHDTWSKTMVVKKKSLLKQ